MIYRAIGLMSGSSLDGLDIVFVEFQEQGGKWTFEIKESACYAYEEVLENRLKCAVSLSALDYQLLHTEYGKYIGQRVNQFIDEKNLYFQVSLIASHGHTTFHLPAKKMTAQLGDGAAIAAETRLPVVTDLRALDVALGGQGAPIVPIGEKLLLSEFDYFLNLGGIANISINSNPYLAFDVCPANRVLNMLANDAGKAYDDKGQIAASGSVNIALLEKLNNLEYYKQAFPKSLANDFGTDVVYPLIKNAHINEADALATYCEHIALQIKKAIQANHKFSEKKSNLLVTGGGAHNSFLIEKLTNYLSTLNIQVVVPDDAMINFKEALIMAFIGVLRWRQENNVLASVTGASRDSIGGALWTGHEE
ncbi:MAG: anhydro-N-acetylmuramic acid kinase [Bacteroidetes bacterium]|nr:anhydro-N-acetylmuramic acid kinase [Bacteroidota bacterium]